MAKLTGPEIKELQKALLDAFRRQEDLEQLLLLELDRQFDPIVPKGSNLETAALSIIQTAERADPPWTADLLRAAASQRPGVAPLQQTTQRLLDRTAAPEERPDCPYPGMVPFTADDARFFHGRKDEIDKMLLHLRGQRLLFVIGSSGSGKSSLISAGLLPKLAESKLFSAGYWLVRTMGPGADPMETLAEALGGDPSDPGAAVSALLAAHPPAQRLLLVIDQFEELFSLADPEERKQFIAAIRALRRSEQCALLIAMRADFYPDLMNSDLWPVDPIQRLEVTSLRGDALKAAIVKPADQRDVQVEPALVERLLRDAADEPGSLPMLQEALELLWARMDDHRLTLDAYEKMGEGGRSGLAVAIAMKADDVLVNLYDDDRPALASLSRADRESLVRRIFLRLIQFGEGRAETRRQQPQSKLGPDRDDPEAFRSVLDALAMNRLLTFSGGEGGGERRVDISHEALILGWPRLHGWLEQRRAAEQARRRLETKAEEWKLLGRGEGGLLDETELPEAERWLASEDSREVGYSTDLFELISRSGNELERKKKEDEDARQRELQSERDLAHAKMRSAKRLRWLLFAASVGLLVSWGLVGQADANRKLAEQYLAWLRPRTSAGTGEEALLKVRAGAEMIKAGNMVESTKAFSDAAALDAAYTFVRVPAGEFIMGSGDADLNQFTEAGPQAPVNVDEFWIMRTEVTNAQYGLCVQAGACRRPYSWPKWDLRVRETRWDLPTYAGYPVANVDWYMARQYARWVGGRLPTEAEWEKACRGEDGLIYPWGNTWDATRTNTMERGPGVSTPVGWFSKDGDSPYGVADMAGNVAEWTGSRYRRYPYRDDDGRNDPEAEGETDWVIRGGDYFDRHGGKLVARCTWRDAWERNARGGSIGFRVVLAPGS